MSLFAKFIRRISLARPENSILSSIIGCVGLWVAARCVVDASKNDEISLIVSLIFLFFIFWRGWIVTSDKIARFNELILLPPTLIWVTWMAYRGVDLFMWWLPGILLIVLLSSSQLVLSLLSISIMLISITLALAPPVTDVWNVIVATSAVVSLVAVYRLARDRNDEAFRLQRHNLELISDAARLMHAEVNEHAELVSASTWLFREIGLSSRPETLNLRDLVHPSDHRIVTKTSRNAIDMAAIRFAANTSCDCRLLRRDGNTFWVHAQFVRTNCKPPTALVSFVMIDDRVRAEEALRESQRKLASQERELSVQFDAAKTTLHARQEVERLAQHDLRSPLKSIEAAAALLRKGRVLSTREEHLLSSIENTAARALSMVTMSLDLYRMEEGTFRFVPETIDLVTIGRSVIAELGHHARSKNLRLEFDAATAGLKAIGNHLLTTSVVENLVRNALEAAPEYSVVTLGLYQGARVGLLIHNDGEVSELVRDDFFEKYVTHGKQGGLGLGTYSARLIARAQGGDLTMTSSAENGTLLVLKLRRVATEASAHTSLRSQLQAFGPSLPGTLIELPLAADSAESSPSIDILVVEDDDHNWMLLLSWLPKHVGARRSINGREAVDALAVRRPDLVIMDLEMPIMSGFEALHRIREMQSSAGEEPSIIYAFTGYDDTDTVSKIRDAGFDGILTKPLQQGEFEDVLRVINNTSLAVTMQGELWIEKNFINAFPAFVDSRRALIDDIERAARVGDSGALRLAAHTLAGSPAIHGFNSGISICRQLVAMAEKQSLVGVDDMVGELRKLLSNPAVR